MPAGAPFIDMAHPLVIIYTAESPLRQPGEFLRALWRDLLDGRALAVELAMRDLRAQYRQTLLGLGWMFALPLANTAVWLFIHGMGILDVQGDGLSYPVFVLTGTILWSIFMDAVNAPLINTGAARPLLSKLNFPRIALVLSGVLQTLFNALIKISVLLIAIAALGVTPTWQLLLFPLGVASLVLTGTVVGVLLTPVGMLYADIGRGLPILMQFVMYLSPVVFPVPSAGWAQRLVELNPLTPILVTSRDLLTGLPPPSWAAFLAISALMAVALGFMLALYRLSMPILIERMGA